MRTGSPGWTRTASVVSTSATTSRSVGSPISSSGGAERDRHLALCGTRSTRPGTGEPTAWMHAVRASSPGQCRARQLHSHASPRAGQAAPPPARVTRCAAPGASCSSRLRGAAPCATSVADRSASTRAWAAAASAWATGAAPVPRSPRPRQAAVPPPGARADRAAAPGWAGSTRQRHLPSPDRRP